MRPLCWDPSSHRSTARTPLLFSFFFLSTFSLCFFFVFSPSLLPFFLPFSVSPPPSPHCSLFRFRSFCLLVFSFSVFFLYRLLVSLPWFLGDGFSYSVIFCRSLTPPALVASLKYAYSPCMLSYFLRCWWYVLFLLFVPFFDFDLDIVCFILSFSCGYYAVSSVSVSAATRLAYDVYQVSWYLRPLISHCYFVWSIRFVYHLFQLLCIILFFFVFFLRQSSGPELWEPVLWPRTAL